MLARSLHVLEIILAVLNLSKKSFSSASHESIISDFNEVNHIRSLSYNILGKTLHNMASLLVTNPMADS